MALLDPSHGSARGSGPDRRESAASFSRPVSRRSAGILGAGLVVVIVGGRLGAADDAQTILAKAKTHLAQGHYEEAIETFARASKAGADPVEIALGVSRSHQSVGAWEDAEQAVAAAVKDRPDQARLLARRAELEFLRGRIAEAKHSAESALRLEPENLVARLVVADVDASTGRLTEANEGYRWFIHYYNSRQPTDAMSLLSVARGAIQYARWNRNRQIFHFVVNTLCPDAIKSDPHAWEAQVLSGSLLLEKYNREQALPDLQRALAMNPRAADSFVLLGEDALDQNDPEGAEAKANEALKINGRLPSALRLRSDVFFITGRIEQALASAELARTINPRDPRTLAREATAFLLLDGLPDRGTFQTWLGDPPIDDKARGSALRGRFGTLWAQVRDWNPKPGVFLAELGRLLESRRRLDAAELCYRRAMAVMPQLPEAKTSLGMLLMRVGKTAEARTILDEAFEADPYHTRVSNFRKVLKLLDGYHVITTEHFVVRVDSKLDKLLGGYMADYLEEIYPELVGQFGFSPPQRTQIEIFNSAEGTSGHEWFSARMVGLPWIQTIGASTGVIMAMASPTSAPVPFNWARVLRHEFVHIITVQQTGFNIPQWFTEALAVMNEGYPPPATWNDLLVDRAERSDLRTLETLDRGFQRPMNSDDWQFAYCQSRLYAEYMIERRGPGSLKDMLAAYRDNSATGAAIKKVFGVDPAEFERGYRQFIRRKTAALRQTARPPRDVERLAKRFKENPGDGAAAGAYAWALLESGQADRARQIAQSAELKDKREPWAQLVLARLEADEQQFAAAIRRLEPLLDRSHPHSEILAMLVKLKRLDDKPAEAAALCDFGLGHYPRNPVLVRELATACDRLHDTRRLTKALTELCDILPDELAPRKRLTAIALAQQRYSDAVRFGKAALYVDVLDAETHRDLGTAYLGLNDAKKALGEFEAAADLKPADSDIELGLSKALVAVGRKADAKNQLRRLLERDGKNPQARAVLDSLQ